MRTAALLFLGMALMRADDIVLTDGTVFKDAKVISHNAKSATISFNAGVAMVKIELLPPGLQQEPVLANFPGTTTNASATPTVSAAPATPVEITPGIKAATDKGGIAAGGPIVQISPDGLVVDLAMIVSQQAVVPHREASTVNIVPTGLGHTPVNQTVVNQWTTLETVTKRVELGVAFVACKTNDLDPIDRSPWSGRVWRVGTYSVSLDDGVPKTMPKYTTDPKEAYRYFASHPDQIPAPQAAIAPDAVTNLTPVQTTRSLSTGVMNP